MIDATKETASHLKSKPNLDGGVFWMWPNIWKGGGL
ncbi:MAG: hypothetical protein CM15mV53_610 [uncultured marine virus]|nr:MAG: hypothetical protein CM15mV53_610 [uncultured marine virus]